MKIENVHIEKVFEHWWNLLPELHSSMEKEVLSGWLNSYIKGIRPRVMDDTLDGTDENLEELLRLSHFSGINHQLYFKSLFLLPQAFQDYTKTMEPSSSIYNELDDSRKIVMDDLAGHIGESFSITRDLLQKELNTTATLLRVTKAANSSLELAKVLRTISDEVVRALNARACNSFLFPDPERVGYYIILDDIAQEGYVVPDPPELFGLDALQRGEPVMCYDAALDPRTDKRTVEFFNLKSLLAFPLISKGRVVAAGLVVMNDYHHFTQSEVDLVMGIANSGALAVENARLHDTQVQLAIAQERDLLGQELHDRIAQTLAVVKLNLNYLLLHQPNDAMLAKIQETKALADEAYQDLRDAILGLRFLKATDYKLSDFKEYLTTYGAHRNVDIRFEIPEQIFQNLSIEILLQVGKIIEEAVVNSCKHASAQHVWLKGAADDHGFQITVEDDGIGINEAELQAIQEEHFGIKIMQERAGKVGGVLTISNRLEGGTCVKLDIKKGKGGT